MSIKLYVEGGGDSKDLKNRCRRGFRKFIERAGLEGRMPRIVACGGRENAYESFKTACEDGGVAPMLLVDAEGPVSTSDPWKHLFDRDGWSRPDGASGGHCHLMVQLMESWFLADRSALAAFYGADFREAALPQNPSVEKIRKEDVLRGLKRGHEGVHEGWLSQGVTQLRHSRRDRSRGGGVRCTIRSSPARYTAYRRSKWRVTKEQRPWRRFSNAPTHRA